MWRDDWGRKALTSTLFYRVSLEELVPSEHLVRRVVAALQPHRAEELRVGPGARTAWAERMVAEAERRGAIIEELQRALAEQGQRPGGG